MSSNERIEVLKNNLVSRLFVNTADQDYALARIAHCMQMDNGFFWLAGQAIEKLLKASLLLNGHSAKNSGHNLIELYRTVEAYASDLLPERLKKPCWLEFRSEFSWQEETPLAFLERIQIYTDPNTRYNVFGTSLRGEDLIHLDQLIFALRRIAFPLDANPFLGKPTRKPGDLRLFERCWSGFLSINLAKGLLNISGGLLVWGRIFRCTKLSLP